MKKLIIFTCLLSALHSVLLAQNVGIGTITPLQRLHVKGIVRVDPIGLTGNSSISMYSGTTSDNSTIFFYNQLSAVTQSASFGYNSFLNYSFWGTGGTAAYLKNEGLGINNPSPLTRLHVSGEQDAGFGANQNGFAMFGLANSSNLVIDPNEIMARNNGRKADLYLQNDSGDVVMCFNNEGIVHVGSSVGIGTASPATKLHILGGQDASLASNGYMLMGNTSGPNLVIDNNEIMSRNNGASAKLFLQADGGETEIGNGEGTYRFTTDGKLQQPAVTGTANLLPVAYGKVSNTGVRQSGTFFTSIKEADGRYRVTVLNENNMLVEESQFTILVTPVGGTGVYISAQIDNANSFLVFTSEFHVPYINKSIVESCGVPCDYSLASYITTMPNERARNAGFSFLIYKN
ncbi:hypothetical protein [Ferruginibacter sp.]